VVVCVGYLSAICLQYRHLYSLYFSRETVDVLATTDYDTKIIDTATTVNDHCTYEFQLYRMNLFTDSCWYEPVFNINYTITTAHNYYHRGTTSVMTSRLGHLQRLQF
jgi:hypothetical protein